MLWKKEFGHTAWKSIAGVASLDAISTTWSATWKPRWMCTNINIP
jgi:hypothetical protein